MIGINNSSSLSFQANFKLVQELLLLMAMMLLPPFEQLEERGANWFWKHVSKQLHNHLFF